MTTPNTGEQVMITFTDSLDGSVVNGVPRPKDPINVRFNTNTTTFQLEQMVGSYERNKISKLVIKTGPFAGTPLRIARDITLANYAGAFTKNNDGMDSIDIFVMYYNDNRGGSSKKTMKKRRKLRYKKRRTNKRK